MAIKGRLGVRHDPYGLGAGAPDDLLPNQIAGVTN